MVYETTTSTPEASPIPPASYAALARRYAGVLGVAKTVVTHSNGQITGVHPQINRFANMPFDTFAQRLYPDGKVLATLERNLAIEQLRESTPQLSIRDGEPVYGLPDPVFSGMTLDDYTAWHIDALPIAVFPPRSGKGADGRPLVAPEGGRVPRRAIGWVVRLPEPAQTATV